VEYIFYVPAESKVIQHVTLNLTQPVVDNTAYNNAATATQVITTEPQSITPSTGLASATPTVEWKADLDGDSTYETTATGGTFASGVAYQATIKNVKAADGWSFADNVDFVINGSTALTGGKTMPGDVTGTLPSGVKSITVTKNTPTNPGDPDTYDIIVTFDKQGSKVVTDVVILTTLMPEHGKPIPAVTVPTDKPYEAVANTLKWEYMDTTDNQWKKVDTTATPNFLPKVEYRVTGRVKLKADDPTGEKYSTNYDITTATNFYLGTLGNVQIPQNGTTSKVTTTGLDAAIAEAKFEATQAAASNVWADDTVYTLTLTFKALEDKTDKVITQVATNVIQPVAGQPVPAPTEKATLLLAQTKDNNDMMAHVETSEVIWKTRAGDPVTSGNFTEDVIYTAEFDVFVKADSVGKGYKFLADTTATPDDYVDFLANGVVHSNGTWLNGADTETAHGITATITQLADTNH